MHVTDSKLKPTHTSMISDVKRLISTSFYLAGYSVPPRRTADDDTVLSL